jgi:arginyl-tRNA synthetase
MILPIHARIRASTLDAVQRLYGLDRTTLPPVVVDYTPSRDLGDLAVPLAFDLARRLRKAPRLIAQELAGAVGPVPGVARVEATPSGYLNWFLDRPQFLIERLRGAPSEVRSPESEVSPPHGPDMVWQTAGGTPIPLAGRDGPEPDKAIVEHTAINPNKAAHIGHLRNAALGDTLGRLLRFSGVPVEIQNYIDDTGVQVADVVVGFRELEGKDLDAVRHVADTTRFDFYCWDLYARVTDWYEADRERLKIRATTLHDIERGDGEAAAAARFIADRIVRRHLETMARMNVDYDLLTWEADILRLRFWARAFEILKDHGAVALQTQGPLAGCWVMKIDEQVGEATADTQEAETAAREGRGPQRGGRDGDPDGEEAESREKVIVRSNGTVTYVGKDIAYQFWKFGVLGRDFHYRAFERRPDGRLLWATTSEPTPEEAAHPPFGRAASVYNVIDVRQSYLQKLLKQALLAIGHPEQAARSVHFSYEMVALSHATARQLGYDISASEAARPFVEVSGRKGVGVKADDLLDALVQKAEAEVVKRNPDLPPPEARRVAEMIAVAAVRYFMVRYSRGKVIVFDIDEALNFEGESGPYLQYAVVRANNIFQKLRDREGVSEQAMLAGLPETPAGELNGEGGAQDLWNLVLEAARLDEIVEQAVRTLELSVLAKYALGAAQTFNAFYHRYPILNEERQDLRRWRAAGVAYFRAQMTRALDLVGIPVPPRM